MKLRLARPGVITWSTPELERRYVNLDRSRPPLPGLQALDRLPAHLVERRCGDKWRAFGLQRHLRKFIGRVAQPPELPAQQLDRDAAVLRVIERRRRFHRHLR